MERAGRAAGRDRGDHRLRTWFMAFFSALAFVGGVTVMVLLAEPPDVIVAIVTVVVVGVLLTTFVPSSVLGRARRRRVKDRAVGHGSRRTAADPIANQE
jgi:Flp pilus assembly protein TadB